MTSRKNSFGNKLDVGWQHGIDIDKNFRNVQCKYCQKIISGGIFRFKQHLAWIAIWRFKLMILVLVLSSSTNVHNIGVGTSSDTNNHLDANDID
jgi:hypothetical protein